MSSMLNGNVGIRSFRYHCLYPEQQAVQQRRIGQNTPSPRAKLTTTNCSVSPTTCHFILAVDDASVPPCSFLQQPLER
jgi:hypothetical protein